MNVSRRIYYYDPQQTFAVNKSLFNWMLNQVENVLLPDNVRDELIDPKPINSMRDFEENAKRTFCELWGIMLSLKYDSNVIPNEVVIEIRGSHARIRFVACLLAQYVIENLPNPLKITSITDLNDFIKVELSKSENTEASKSLITFFGGKEEIINAIDSRPDFWRSLVSWHILSNYNMVTIHRNYFEDMFAGKVPAGELTIEALAKKPIKDIPLREMLFLIKEVYETSRIADRVDIDDDTVIVFHSYRTREAVEKLKQSLVALLESRGYLYDVKSTASMIILKQRLKTP